MDKVIFDSFEPDVACFEPPPPALSQPDLCKVKAKFHSRENPTAPQPEVFFQREKDHFVYAPGTLAIPVLQGFNFDEKSPAAQSALHFEVFMGTWYRNNYPEFKAKTSYKGADLLPLSTRLTHFITSGDIEKPDAVQTKNLSSLMKEFLTQPEAAKVWFRSMFKSLLDPNSNLKYTPLPMRPRVQWVVDQMNLYEDLKTSFSSFKVEGGDAALQSDLLSFSVDLMDYLNTGQQDLKTLKTSLDRLSKRVFNSEAWGEEKTPPKELKDLFRFFSKKIEPLKKESFYAQNTAAAGRLSFLEAHLKQAASEHRAELLSLPPSAAFQKSLQYRLQEAAEKGYLASRVKGELNEANLSPQWLKDNAKEIYAALLPCVVYSEKTQRVSVDVESLTRKSNDLVKNHYIQRREYQIGVLAVMRYLFGDSFSDSTTEGWVKDRYQPVEIEMGEDSSRKLLDFRDHLKKEIQKSVDHTSFVLPLAEGGILAVGAGLGTYGLIKGKGTQNIFTTTGAIGIGAGGGALLCNALWKSRNQYITDGICGLLGGAALGLGSTFLPNAGGVGAPPGPNGPNPDGRNPVTPWGP